MIRADSCSRQTRDHNGRLTDHHVVDTGTAFPIVRGVPGDAYIGMVTHSRTLLRSF